MKTMTWEEIDKDWNGIQKRHRMEIAQAVARYCVGHKMEELAKRLKYSHDWVVNQLDYAGIGMALGGPILSDPLTGSTDNVAKEVPRLLKKFGPSVQVVLDDDGKGNQTVADIKGADAEEFRPYLDRYLDEDHTPAAATRLAKAQWAAEEAVNAGVIRESRDKQNKRVNQILFPPDDKETFDLDLKMHMARVKSAAVFLDKSKVRNLRRKSTCEKVAEADAAWREQAELVLQHHQPSGKD